MGFRANPRTLDSIRSSKSRHVWTTQYFPTNWTVTNTRDQDISDKKRHSDFCFNTTNQQKWDSQASMWGLAGAKEWSPLWMGMHWTAATGTLLPARTPSSALVPLPSLLPLGI